MRIALDSNRYTDLRKGQRDVLAVLERATEIYVPVIVLAELRAGFAAGTRREENERILTQFLNKDGVYVLAADESTTFVYADLYAYLRKKGTPVPTNDLWIAALAVQHSLVLFDRDKHFDQFPQLSRVNQH
ncbi:MAG: type II toxin-antitoxin system VapC family toxin [Polyangiaceae bacterium]|nr:type II toxin-antitoxin system VapC family toxin [Polyangiaceae bacterium]